MRNRLPGFRDLRLLESGHARALILSHLMGVAHVYACARKINRQTFHEARSGASAFANYANSIAAR
jgi:hypothetical protein